MVSISGIRGIVGDTLTPEVIVRYASAFGEYCKRKHPGAPEVVLGRDGRITGKIIANIVASTLLSTGVRVRALGICPTPTVALAVEKGGAAGGISVTASHNPIQWNGMKFISSTGLFLDAEENSELWAIAKGNSIPYAPWNSIGTHVADDSWIGKHIDAVIASGFIDVGLVKHRQLKVVVDCVNTAGGAFIPSFLRSLGCAVIELHCDVSGIFAHTPEPLPENLTELAARVKKEKADIGIAVDPDVDRLVLITETGEPLGEEYTIALAVQFVLERASRSGTSNHSVVINLSTTRAVEDIAKTFGAKTYRTPVGEINVAKKMREVGAIIGGEGSGGVILPAVHTGRDAIVGIALILQMLAEFKGSLSELKATLPQYSIAKGKIEIRNGSTERVIERMKSETKGRISTADGVRIDYDDYWIHLRKSNTEPIVRIIAEAATLTKAEEIVETVKEELLS